MPRKAETQRGKRLGRHCRIADLAPKLLAPARSLGGTQPEQFVVVDVELPASHNDRPTQLKQEAIAWWRFFREREGWRVVAVHVGRRCRTTTIDNID